jgi:hypothetical protein
MNISDRQISILALLVALIPLLVYFARSYLPKVSFRVGNMLVAEPINVPRNGRIHFAVFTESKRRIMMSGVWVEFDPDEVDLSKTKGAEQRLTTDGESPVALFFPEVRIVAKGHLQANHFDYQARKDAFRVNLVAYATVDVAELPWLLDMFGPKTLRVERTLRFSVSADPSNIPELGLVLRPKEGMSVEGPQAQEAIWAKTDKAGTAVKIIEFAEKEKK